METKLLHYLATGLKAILTEDKTEEYISEHWFTEKVSAAFLKGVIWQFCGYAEEDLMIPLGYGEIDGFIYRNGDTYVNFRSGIKPLLRPMSDMNKSIEHNGKTFIPLIELAKIAYEKNNKFELTHDYVDTGMGYTFHFDKKENSFDCRRGYDGKKWDYNCYVPNQFALFQKLLEWNFNVFDLPENSWVDINTVSKPITMTGRAFEILVFSHANKDNPAEWRRNKYESPDMFYTYHFKMGHIIHSVWCNESQQLFSVNDKTEQGIIESFTYDQGVLCINMYGNEEAVYFLNDLTKIESHASELK